MRVVQITVALLVLVVLVHAQSPFSTGEPSQSGGVLGGSLGSGQTSMNPLSLYMYQWPNPDNVWLMYLLGSGASQGGGSPMRSAFRRALYFRFLRDADLWFN